LAKAKARLSSGAIHAEISPHAEVAATRITKTALELIGETNRRLMSPWLLGFAFVSIFLLTVGAEYFPPRSDAKHEMFGYVQAPWITDYPTQCPDCTLLELQRQLNRRIAPVGGVTVDRLASYRIVKPYYQRTGGALEFLAFVLFMISVLGLEIFFGIFILWTAFKGFVFLQLIYRAIAPSDSCVIGLHLRYGDRDRMFGLEAVHRALLQLVGLVGAGIVLQILSWWTNILKGSQHILGQDVYSLGGWLQFLVSNGSFIVGIVLLIYVFYISGKAREGASEESKRIATLPRRGGGGLTKAEDALSLIAEQSVWRKVRYTSAYILAPVVCVTAGLVLNRLDIARAIGNVWEGFLKHIFGSE